MSDRKTADRVNVKLPCNAFGIVSIMTTAPRSALILGLAGLIPFLWGALTIFVPNLQALGGSQPRPALCRALYPAVLRLSDLVLHVGCTLGLCDQDNRRSSRRSLHFVHGAGALGVFMTGGGPVGASTNLAFGFAGLLMLDYTFFKWQLTPPWWMQLACC